MLVGLRLSYLSLEEIVLSHLNSEELRHSQMASAAVSAGVSMFSSLFAPFVRHVDPKTERNETVPLISVMCPSTSSLSSSSEETCNSSDWSRSSSSKSTCSCSDDKKFDEEDYVPDASEMRRVFERLDENKDGLICLQDLHKFMKRLGLEMSDEEAFDMLKSVDHNDDGKIDFEEFYSLYQSLSNDDMKDLDAEGHEDENDTLLQAFLIFDKNEDGFITAKELQTVLLDLGLSEGKSLKSCEEMIQRVDSDGNGEIDITEFKTMMCSKCYLWI